MAEDAAAGTLYAFSAAMRWILFGVGLAGLARVWEASFVSSQDNEIIS